MLAPAKINLDLRVLGRRADGYHELDSRVVFAALGDEVSLAGEHGTLNIAGPFAQALESDSGNLVLKAAHALAERTGRPLDTGFRLAKKLPVAAGLGGGSSDAAAALRLLGDRWSVADDVLMQVAARVGADVPVCLLRRPARMTGIGEQLALLEQSERARLCGLPMLLVNPRLPVPTGAVFAALAQGYSGDWLNEGAALAENNLLAPALSVQPAIAEVLSALADAPGATTYGMSGSGPTCFALFTRMADCAALAGRIAQRQPGWWVAPTRLL